jgi:uncharacterized protein YjbJ (UPF0337 family)
MFLPVAAGASLCPSGPRRAGSESLHRVSRRAVSLLAVSGKQIGTGSRGEEITVSDKFDNKAEELKGKAKEGVGKATDDEGLERQGKTDQAKGNLKQAGENVKDAARGLTGDK